MRIADDTAWDLHNLTCVAPLLDRQQARGLVALLPPVPRLYARYFRGLPDCVPVAADQQREAFRLAYVGIAPRRLRTKDGQPARATLRSRILGSRLGGNSAASTLRLPSVSCWRGASGLPFALQGRAGR